MGYSLYNYCMERKIIPIRSKRWCTVDFKIKPIHRFLRHIGATTKKPVQEDIGISLDEIHRMNFNPKDPKYIAKVWPLIDNKITRRECYTIIKEHGWPVPVKSGCDFCPYAKRKEIRQLSADHPERFMQIVKLQENDRDYKKYPMFGRSLRDTLLNSKISSFFGSKKDEDEDDATCDSGNCFT